ncbi:MAG: RICIN domain-containing protein [Ruminococcus sp.]|nr:RICIN domain-containing protein [Ruminococcus sp.]
MKLKRILSLVLAGALVCGTSALGGAPTRIADAAGTRVSVHDPSIVKDGSTYYVFGSHIEAAKSADLQNWRSFANGYARTNNVEFGNLSQNLKKAFDWAGEDLEDCKGGFAVWAPDVFWDAEYVNSDGSKGAYLMYFCTSSTYMRSVIAFAVSKNIEGPYTFADTLIYSGFTNNDSYATSDTKRVNRKYTSTNVDELIAQGQVTFNNSWFNKGNFNNQLFPNAIDPTIYTDTSGKMYMCYGSWSGGIFTLEVDPKTGYLIHPKTGTTSDGRMVDSYFGTKISGGYGKSGEGPFIEYNIDNGYYYLWVTYGGLTSTGGYNMRVFRSRSPLGPFTDPAGRNAVLPTNPNLDSVGLKVMGNYKFSSLSKAYMACGHNSVLRDDDGKWYLIYHTRFDDGAEFHEVRVHSMYFNADGWPVVAPFEYSGDEIWEGGYDVYDIIGAYEFIDHGTSTDGKIINYQKISLNSDNTISGAVTGTWEQDPESSEATLIIEGKSYKGYFLAAKNEAGKMVMSFTAVGNNNHTVWGAKSSPFSGTLRSGMTDYTDHKSQLVVAEDTLGEPSKSTYIKGTQLLSGVPYYITNVNSGLAIDLPNGKLNEGTNIQQWEVNKLWAQQWMIITVDDEWCRIVSMGDESKCIAVASDTAADGTNVELQTYTGADNQLFKIVNAPGCYGIVSKCSGGAGALDVFEWSKENGGNVNQYAYHEYDCQLWKISPVCPEPTVGNYYYIKDAEYGRYVTLGKNSAGSNTGLVISSEGQSKPTKWFLYDGGNGTYSLGLPQRGGMSTVIPILVAVEDNSSENGAYVEFMSVRNEDAALKIIGNKDGSYTFLTPSSDYKSCFTCFYGSETDADIVQQEYSAQKPKSTRFVLEPVQPDPKKLSGDVNADGTFGVADLVLMQKYLLGAEKELPDWQAGDLDEDGRLDMFDLVKMRQLIVFIMN